MDNLGTLLRIRSNDLLTSDDIAVPLPKDLILEYLTHHHGEEWVKKNVIEILPIFVPVTLKGFGETLKEVSNLG